MTLRLPGRTVSLPARGAVMGILNINDDSFSGDGKVDADWALSRAVELVAQGADFIDIGAESARTNRSAIAITEEIARLESFLTRWPEAMADSHPRDDEQIWPPVLSINTWRPEVAAATLAMGGELLNDMGGLPDDRNARLCADSGAALLIMHTVGLPKVDHSHIRWDDVLTAQEEFFSEKIALAESAGLHREQLVLDPGLGFAKSPADDLAVLRQLDRLHRFGLPLLLPLGRKGFIGEALDLPEPRDRDAGTLAALALASEHGPAIYRVHEVTGAFEVLKTLHGLRTI